MIEAEKSPPSLAIHTYQVAFFVERRRNATIRTRSPLSSRVVVTFFDFGQKGAAYRRCHRPDDRPGPWQRSSPLGDPLLFVIPSVPGFPAALLSSATPDVVLFKENHTQPTEAATLDRKSGEAEGSAVPRTTPGNPE
jgi:hypothetical protein